MVHRPSGIVNPALLWLWGLAACVSDPAHAPRQPTFEAPASRMELQPQVGPGHHGIVGEGPGHPRAGRIEDLPEDAASMHASAVGDDSIMLKLASPLVRADFASDGGDAMAEALSVFPQRRVDTYGAALLTTIQVFGDSFHAPICESSEIDVPLTDADGNRWDAALDVAQYLPFVGDPTPVMSALSDACVAGLTAYGGDVDAAVAAGACSVDEDEQFFGAEGTTCRACVAGNGGSFSACVDDGSCTEEAPSVTWVEEDGEKAWYQVVEAEAWACRPSWLALVYLLAHIPPDGTLPESYDHADWNYYCFPLYDTSTDSINYTCDAGDSPERGSTLGEGIPGRTISMTDADGNVDYTQREYYTPDVQLKEGYEVRWSWANSENIGRLSKPIVIPDTNGDGVTDLGDDLYGYPNDSWGINPHALRPGGTDPTSLDDTYARDWFALLALKTATTEEGLPVLTANYNRCASWDGPDDEGRSRCTETTPPDGDWLNDGLHYGETTSDGQIYSYAVPILTLGATGLADPDIPGGIVPLIAGSDRLAEPDWEDCVWPHSFVVDQIPFPDSPWDYAGPQSMMGDTYRFGKDPDLDLRMVISTNVPRHYCPEDE